MRVFPATVSAATISALALLTFAGCDDRYLIGFPPDGAPPPDMGTGGSAGGTGGTQGGSEGGGSGGAGGGGGSGGAGGGGGSGGAGGTTTSPPAASACPVAPAPLPVEALEISTYHAADRLSRFLWGSRSDAALLARARTLKTNIDVQVLARDMLKDGRAQATARALMRRWLQLDTAVPNPDTGRIGAAAVRETDAFVTRVLLFEDGLLSTLLTAPFTFVDDRDLAAAYAAPPVVPVGFSRINIDSAQRRSGILTHVSVLVARPRATTRGMWIRNALLCQAPPAPPIDIPAIAEPSSAPATYRQRLERVVSAYPACSTCHNVTDPPGFALERFDGAGRPRDLDEGLPIDDSGHLEGPVAHPPHSGARWNWAASWRRTARCTPAPSRAFSPRRWGANCDRPSRQAVLRWLPPSPPRTSTCASC